MQRENRVGQNNQLNWLNRVTTVERWSIQVTASPVASRSRFLLLNLLHEWRWGHQLYVLLKAQSVLGFHLRLLLVLAWNLPSVDLESFTQVQVVVTCRKPVAAFKELEHELFISVTNDRGDTKCWVSIFSVYTKSAQNFTRSHQTDPDRLSCFQCLSRSLPKYVMLTAWVYFFNPVWRRTQVYFDMSVFGSRYYQCILSACSCSSRIVASIGKLVTFSSFLSFSSSCSGSECDYSVLVWVLKFHLWTDMFVL